MRKVNVGEKYRHFKGGLCEIIAIAKDSETLKDVVVYSHDGEIWVRDYDMFLSKVDHKKYPDIKQEFRFELIKK